MDPTFLLEPLGAACRQAGEAIRLIREDGFVVESKNDASPVTEADRAAEQILLSALKEQAPDVPVIAEEEVAAGRIPESGRCFFLVDPLDGTKEFVRGGQDYTVNVGLVVEGQPVLGLVYAPEQRRLYSGIVGQHAWLEDHDGARTMLRTRLPESARSLTVVASKSHLNAATLAYLETLGTPYERAAIGSSLKFCLLAEGSAHLYPRLSPTSEWDTAAGHAVLLAAGGRVDGPDGRPLIYGKAGFLNFGFVATSGWKPPSIVGLCPTPEWSGAMRF